MMIYTFESNIKMLLYLLFIYIFSTLPRPYIVRSYIIIYNKIYIILYIYITLESMISYLLYISSDQFKCIQKVQNRVE